MNLSKVGTILSFVTPNKKNKERKNFAFVRFAKNIGGEEIVNKVKNLWIGSYKLLANVAKFERVNETRGKVEERKKLTFFHQYKGVAIGRNITT